MAKELIDILTRSAEVRDETGAAENTASKVGSILTDLIDFIEVSTIFKYSPRNYYRPTRQPHL